MNANKTSLTLALTAVLGAAAGVANSAHAAGNPFAMQALNQGYQVAAADDKAMEGKCGGKKEMEGKCGGDKAGTKAKTKEGKCGEGKCGGSKAKPKAMEGKCGGDKSDAKAMEGKCGGSK